MNRLNFFIPCVPPSTTAQAHNKTMVRGKHAFVYTDPVGKALKNNYIALLSPFRPKEPFCKAIQVNIVFSYPWRKSEKKSVITNYHYTPKISKPDRDNMVKALFDSMSMLHFWTDDQILCDGFICKLWGETPGIGIEIVECPQSYDIKFNEQNGVTTWELITNDNSTTISE